MHPLDLIALARVAARHRGYALAVHGSLSRDVDLLAVPWTDTAADPAVVVEAIRKAVGGWLVVAEPNRREGYYMMDDAEGADKRSPVERPHGRTGWRIFGALKHSYIDLSVMPPLRAAAGARPPEGGATARAMALEEGAQHLEALAGAYSDYLRKNDPMTSQYCATNIAAARALRELALRASVGAAAASQTTTEVVGGSCLICGQDRPYAAWHYSGVAGVCEECRNAARQASDLVAHPDLQSVRAAVTRHFAPYYTSEMLRDLTRLERAIYTASRKVLGDTLLRAEQVLDEHGRAASQRSVGAEAAPGEPTDEDSLKMVRGHLTQRIAWAAKNDDGEAAGLFIALATAIDNMLEFCSGATSQRQEDGR